MTTVVVDSQANAELSRFARSAFRLELQPSYDGSGERDLFDSFLAGTPEPPDSRDDFRAYYDDIRRKTASGVTVERVRLVDTPPTDYQRWTRYMDRWNIDAGETIHYLSRTEAARCGLTTAYGGRDWWLLDDQRLYLMTFTEGRRTQVELITKKNELKKARSWRDLAITAAQGEN